MSERIIELNGILVTTDAIHELDGEGSRLVSVPRDGIVALQLQHGHVADRPVVAGGIGATLLLGGLLAGAAVLRNLIAGDLVGRRVAYLLCACSMAVLGGGWLAWHAFRKGTFVLVELRSEKRKLAFRSNPPPELQSQFLRALQQSPRWSALLR